MGIGWRTNCPQAQVAGPGYDGSGSDPEVGLEEDVTTAKHSVRQYALAFASPAAHIPREATAQWAL